MQLLGTTMVGGMIARDSFASDGYATPQQPQPVFIPAGSGKKGKIGEGEIVFKLDKSHTSGNIGSSEFTLPPGYLGAPPHHHKAFDEICIVQEGTLHIMVGDEVFEVKAGGWHLRPRGITHTFWNSGTVPAKFIEIYSPAGHEDYMLELAQMFEDGNRPKPDDLNKLAAKHDIFFEFGKLRAIMEKYKVRL